MIILTDYEVRKHNGLYYIVPTIIPPCPQCGGAMKIRDTKKRKVIMTEGTVRTFQLRRYKCSVCGSIHIEMPDIMVPHKHYERAAILSSIRGENICAAEQATINRWVKEKKKLDKEREEAERKKAETENAE